MMRFLKLAFLLLPALYVLALAALYFGQRSLLYIPNSARITPQEAGVPGVEALTLTTADNETIIAWHRAPVPGKPLILYFHGNGGNLGGERNRLRAMTEGGYGLFAIDYRGYGGSTGAPSEAGLLMDAEAAFVKLAELGYGSENIVLYGQSLGTGIAIASAARHKVRAIVLEAPYSAAVDVAEARFWMFPVRGLMIDTIRSDERIGAVTAPLLMIHGDADRTIPIRFGLKLFARAREPKEFVTLPGAAHLLLLLPGVASRIRQWIDTQTAEK